MIVDVLMEAGLASGDAHVYAALLESGVQTAGELAKKIKQLKRPTLYNILRDLKDRGLVAERRRRGKLMFAPLPPLALLSLAESRRKDAEVAAERVEKAVAELQSKYLISFMRPAIKYYEGVDELKLMYERFLKRKGGDAYLIRSNDPLVHKKHFGKWWGTYVSRRAKTKTRVHALTPDHARAVHDPEVDAANNVIRTWINSEDYASAVDIHVTGDILAVSSYGKELFSLTIENAEIARAFADVFRLAEKGAKTTHVSHDHE